MRGAGVGDDGPRTWGEWMSDEWTNHKTENRKLLTGIAVFTAAVFMFRNVGDFAGPL